MTEFRISDGEHFRHPSPSYGTSSDDKILDPVEPEPVYSPPGSATKISASAYHVETSHSRNSQLSLEDVEISSRPRKSEIIGNSIARIRCRCCCVLPCNLGHKFVLGLFLMLVGSVVWLVSYLHRKHLRPPNWSSQHNDYEEPFLVLVLIVVGLLVTGTLIALYWPSFEWACTTADDCWERGCPWNVFSPIIMVLWLCGFVLCAAPPIALAGAAIAG